LPATPTVIEPRRVKRARRLAGTAVARLLSGVSSIAMK
jgi:hypothetical protein